MKLSRYTIRNLSLPLLVVMLLWSSVFYVLIMHEIDDETNDTLENYKELIIRRALTDPGFEKIHQDEMTRYRIREVDPGEADFSKNTFYDSSTYIELEMEYEPVRVLKSHFMDAEGRCFEIVIETSTLEKEDMLETIFWSIIVLYIVLLCCILLVTHYVMKKSFTPFYDLLKWLKTIHPGKEEHYGIKTNVDEFITLNDALQEATKRNREIYNEQKQFVENAAHELQTPLAIATNKLELLGEHPDCTEEQLAEIGDIYNVLRGVIRMNKSLLLLSRIENRQFPETSVVDINKTVQTLLDNFAVIYEAEKIHVSFEEQNKLEVMMNDSLALILVSNLIKNAFAHNYAGGSIHIRIAGTTLYISNTSRNQALDKKKLFTRFHKGTTSPDSTGLGLAIVKSIASLYNMTVGYEYRDQFHQFHLHFKN